MKKLLGIVVLGLLLIYFVALVPNNAEAKPDWSKCSGDKTASFDYIPLFCYGNDGKLLSENERKIIDKEWKRGKAISYNGVHELPEHARPNEATISLFEERKKKFIKRRRREGRLYTIAPKGNAVKFTYQKNLPSLKLEKQLSEGDRKSVV